MYNFTLVNCDTDSISICKPDGSAFSEEEKFKLIEELNSLFPENIKFDDDGFFERVIVLKAKNYILFDGKKIKTKGSSLKDSKAEKALKDFMNDIIKAIINNTGNYREIYDQYAREIMDIKDISRWSSKKTISSKVLTSERTNESKVRDVIDDTEYTEGDKIWVYFKSDGSLGLAEHFDGDYDRDKMLEKLFKKSKVFENVLPEDIFINYKLKKNKAKLEQLFLEEDELICL